MDAFTMNSTIANLVDVKNVEPYMSNLLPQVESIRPYIDSIRTYLPSMPSSVDNIRPYLDNTSRPRLTWTAVLSCLFVCFIVYTGRLLVQRLVYSPLATIPGPKAAAASRLYELWFQGIRHLKFPDEIKRLHRKYGPIVRISPHEVSINDSRFNHKFFNSGELDKDPKYYAFGFDDAVFVLSDNKKWSERQTVMANHFRGKVWQDFFPMLRRELGTLCDTLRTAAENGTEYNVSRGFRKTSNDIMRTFLLGDEYSGINANSRDFGPNAKPAFHPLFRMVAFTRVFKWMFTLHEYMPDFVLETLLPMAKYKREIDRMVRSLVSNYQPEEEKLIQDKALFYRMIDSDPSYLERDGVAAVEEFLELMWGGREVLGHASSNIVFHLVNNPQVMEKLHAELLKAPFDLHSAPYSQLKTIPYLWAVCKEGLRIQLGGNFRIPRVTRKDVQYGEHMLPAGTAVSMCPKFFHDDPEIYPNPLQFLPERWIEADAAKLEEMEMFWNPFGNGARTCGGRPMAYEVVFRIIARIFVQFRLDWSHCDADSCRDERILEAFPPVSSTGMRVTVQEWDE